MELEEVLETSLQISIRCDYCKIGKRGIQKRAYVRRNTKNRHTKNTEKMERLERIYNLKNG